MRPPPHSPEPDDGREYAPGEVLLGRYRIVARLGKGGQGHVYRADDLLLGPQVALKFLNEGHEAWPGWLERFRAEVRLARAVSHPNVARVHDIGEVDGELFLSMEFVDGEDLASLVRRIGRLPGEKATEIARQVCAGLAEAHKQGVLHRDLKPANVMLDARGLARITDFGLAIRAGDQAPLAGTLQYMAPEQVLHGRPASVRTEVYALGLLLYELYTGRRALRGRSFEEVRREHEAGGPEPSSDVLAELDPAVDRVLRRCLERDPRDRPPSVIAVAMALPGGDPLAAALAAGETPAPEVVAAAGSGRGLEPKAALGLALAGAGLFVAVIALMGPAGIRLDYGRARHVLIERADGWFTALTSGARPADAAHWYQLDEALEGPYFARRPPAGAEPGAGPPLTPLLHHSRYSNAPLEPRGDRIAVDDPELSAGSAHLVQNGAGEVLAWTWSVPSGTRLPAAGAEQAVRDLLAATGLALGLEARVASQRTPRVFANGLSAWELADTPSAGTKTRVELATLDGWPVQLEVAVQDHVVGAPSSGRRWGWGLLPAAVALVALGLAWRNWKLRRADLFGARRLGLFGGTAQLVSVFARPFPGGVAASVELLVHDLGRAFVSGAFVYVCYLAVEPIVRRRWPRALVSWSRLLRGETRDPMVGREVLLGAFAFPAFFSIAMALMLLLANWGIGLDETPPASCQGLEGPLQTLAMIVNGSGSAIAAAATFVLILAVLRSLVRPAWLANVAWLVLITPAVALGARFPLPQLLFALTALILLSRVGFLALVVFFFVFLGLARAALTLDPADWYFPQSLAALAVYAALLAWGYGAATRGRTLFGQARASRTT